MNEFEITSLVTILANLISEQCDDTAILAAVFTQLGDTLATIAAVNALSDRKKQS